MVNKLTEKTKTHSQTLRDLGFIEGDGYLQATIRKSGSRESVEVVAFNSNIRKLGDLFIALYEAGLARGEYLAKKEVRRVIGIDD